MLIFRPHNVYGPDMGFEHVIPQFALRLKRAAAQHTTGKVPFEIQGDGAETRSFCHVDDLVAGVMVMRDKGEHLGIYHVGTTEEVTIADLARRIAAHCRPRDRVRRRPAARRRHRRGAAPISRSSPSSAIRPQRAARRRACRRRVDWYWANESLAPKA